MYELTGILIFIVLFIFGAFLVPFYAPLRCTFMRLSKPRSAYDDSVVYELLSRVERGTSSQSASFSLMWFWLLLSTGWLCICAMFAMLWPLGLLMILGGFVFHKTVYKKSPKNDSL
jgi:ABC-type antimicrobial peptide transport system permease subunit